MTAPLRACPTDARLHTPRPRFLVDDPKDAMKAAAGVAYLATVPGMPIVYMGPSRRAQSERRTPRCVAEGAALLRH
jgi:hypothetical protein